MPRKNGKISSFEERVLERSVSTEIDIARGEWEQLEPRKLAETVKSICGHRVKNAAVIRNRHNEAVEMVGKACANKLLRSAIKSTCRYCGR